MGTRGQKLRVVLGLLLTLSTLHFIFDRLLIVVVLVLSWAMLFFPWTLGELVLLVVAALFFLLQNYVSLKAGLFEFRFKDVLLMPYYEPLLWGFYFLSMKRFVSGGRQENVGALDKKGVAGVVVTSTIFSLFAFDSRALFIASACSTVFLLALFHTKVDVCYALFALGLGFIMELFGVSGGFWKYPAPDFLGIPYWFATMWVSVGLLGRRFLIPGAEWLAVRIENQRA
jgi:hypothetical protein